MADMMFALGQSKKKKQVENMVRETKADLKNVNITETVEKGIRDEQFGREQKWKQDGRDQIKKNTNFDMARSLFGGGGGAVAQDEEEEEQAPPAHQPQKSEPKEEEEEELAAEEEEEEEAEADDEEPEEEEAEEEEEESD
jgi:hypothetical protein